MKRFRLIEERSSVPGLSPQEAEADRVDYIACVRQVIRSPMNPMAGVQLEEMEKGLRILKALDGKKIGDVLELEDADWAHLCEKVRTTRWTVVDERLVRFSHTILNATETVIDEPYGSPSEHANGSGSLSAAGGVDGRAGRLRARPVPGPPKTD